MRGRLRRSWYAAVCALLAVPASSALAAVTVGIERLADGAVRVHYELGAETTELVFAEPPFRVAGNPRPQWRESWTVLGETLTLQDDRIASTSGSPFAAVSVRIEPVEGFAPTAVTTIGAQSSVVDLRFMLPQAAGEVSFELRNAFDVRARACVDDLEVDGARAPKPHSGDAWLVVVTTSRDACRASIREGDVTLVADGAPAQLQVAAARELASAYRRLSGRLGRPLDPPPTLILVHRPRSGSSVLGGRRGTDSVVLAALQGDTWVAPTARNTSALTFHLTRQLTPAWLAGVVVPAPEPLRVGHWLVDGAAEYLAALERRSVGQEVYGETPGLRLLADIDLCSRQVEWPASPRPVAPVDRGPRLSCGLLIQFVYDAITRAETAGQRTIFDVWADVLAEADGGPIDPASFLATNARAHAAVAGLVDGPSGDFEAIAAALRNAGIDASLGDPRDTGGAVAALLRVLVSTDCPEGLAGAGPLGGHRVPIKTRGTCRTLPQQVELVAIAGVGSLTSARDVYAATAEACAERGRVLLTGAAATQVFEIDCPESVPALPRHLYLRNVHFLN